MSEQNPNSKIRIWLTKTAGDDELSSLLGEDAAPLAYDVQILQAEATVGDYLQAIEDFQTQTLAECKGCDGCCHERAPLTIADWELAQTDSAAEPKAATLAAWLNNWAELHFCGEAVDLTLPRPEQDACRFLDERQKCCTVHTQRTFTCRTHCCLPKTARAERLRAALINAGEDELVRRLLQIPPQIQPWAADLQKCRIEDYAANAFSALPATQWRRAKLRDLLDDELFCCLL